MKTTVAAAPLPSTPTHHHHTGSAASGGGTPPPSNPAYGLKGPNYCPACGESMAPHQIKAGDPTGGQATGEMPAMGGITGNPLGAIAGGLPSGLAEMTGSPAMGAKGHARKKAAKAKTSGLKKKVSKSKAH